MNKSNLIRLLITSITSLFLLSGITFADGDGYSLDAADGSPTDAVYVDNDGNVGIGTNTPSTEFDVWDGRISIKSPYDGAYLRFRYGSKDTFSEIGMTQWPGSSGLWIGSNLNSLAEAHRSPTQANSSYSSWYAFINSSGDYFRINRISPGNESNASSYFHINGNGNVGIGTTTPYARLHLQNTGEVNQILNTNTAGSNAGIYLTEGGIASPTNNGVYIVYDGIANNFYIKTGTSSYSEKLTIQRDTGNVGIGTTNPGNYKLAVEGKIGAREVVVTESAWADHVFEENYKLPNLSQVESYIKENKHLPDIPSAKQVEEEGLSMAEMMSKQMQKIEELTLYLIEMKKENEAIKKELAKMQKNIN